MSPAAHFLLKAARALDVAAWIRWSMLLAYSALITWMMLAPSVGIVRVLWLFPHADKALHFLAYGFFVWVFRWALAAHHRFSSSFVVVTLGAIGYGAFMEWLQSLIAAYARSFEWLDIVSNSLGALFFWALSGWLSRRVAAAQRSLEGRGREPTS